MHTRPDTDGKHLPRRYSGGWHRWHRWLLYALIAVSAYLLVALAKALPDALPDAAHVIAATGVPASAR